MSFDDLITKFEADDRAYLAAVARMGAATVDFGAKVGTTMTTIAEKFRFAELLAPLAALGTATGLVELGKKAVDTAMQFDVLERKLQGVTGSMARAKEIMRFAEGESAKTGLFDPESLDRASVKLEGFGLNAQKYLPMLERFTAIFGDGASSIDEMAVALGRLEEGGNSGRILTMLARYGVGRDDLKAQGVRFKGNQLTSKPDVVLEAIGRISQEPKFQGTMDDLTNSPTARAAAAGNAAKEAYRQAGDAILSTFLPAATAARDVTVELVEGHYFDKLTNSVLEFFGIQGGNLSTAVKQIGDWAKELPEKLRALKQSIQPVTDALIDGGRKAYETWQALPEPIQKTIVALTVIRALGLGAILGGVGSAFAFAGGWVADFVKVVGGIGPAVGIARAAFVAFLPEIALVTAALWGLYKIAELVKALMDWRDAEQKHFDAEQGQGSQVGDAFVNDYKRKHPGATMDEISAAWKASPQGKKRAADYDKAHPGSASSADKAAGMSDLAQAQLDAQRQTARNTKETAEKLKDLTKHAFGGGDLQREGGAITEAEIGAGRGNGFSRGSTGHIRGLLSDLGSAIEAHTSSEVNRAIGNMMRQGYSS